MVERRTDKGWTQSELAKRAGVHRVTICNLESAKVKELGFSKVHAILSQLGAEIAFPDVGESRKNLKP